MEKIYWIDALNNKTDLTNYVSISPMQGKSGHFMPVFTLNIINLQMLEGSMVTGVFINPRIFSLPLALVEKNYYKLTDIIRELSSTLNPVLGDGKLQFYHHLLGKELTCRYVGGLEGSDASNFFKSQMAILQFRADDPYFYDIDETVLTKHLDISGGTFFKYEATTPGVWDPFFPINLTAGSLFASFSIVNLGDVIAYPVWRIYNAGANLTLKNATTGKDLTIEDSWSDGDYWEIDTTATHKTIKKNGVNAWQYVSTNAYKHNLWGLEKGNNNIQIILTATSINTYVTCSYKFRYLGI